MRFKVFAVGVMLLGLSACGFHIPNQNRLGSSLTEIDVTGAYHNQFYKLVVQKLQVRGVKVNYQGTANRDFKGRDNVPTLEIAAPKVSLPIVSVNAFGSAKEYNMVVTTSAILKVPNHSKPIIIRNGISRLTLNKGDNSLASANERRILLEESLEELSDQMIRRINYLGKQSDPDSSKVTPAQLVLAKDEDNNEVYIDNSPSMTLLDALKAQQTQEEIDSDSVALSELNNGLRVLNPEKKYELPKAKIKMVNEAPDDLTEEGFIKKGSSSK
ncbi:LPS assembly lipoprotein LptE [Succinivibrio dextrinosolvens]|jgi:outer membrane lipopolysaccharide assembly protein LptE/RlpB|uniref:LPS-assembly lipoprotein LptE n=1 Tax=Succinivibrio dextrinosolvens TaxID=83771 RepID=UPI00241D8E62|nr:LPS assembly lipoprotein LptE [Succinivibrio dextrinosolvens]MBE6422244.1 hypothetical protein [Succinivibrio dextrinosolvens]MBQ3678961.1 hypothetical protein [Succinivibrio sp.]